MGLLFTLKICYILSILLNYKYIGGKCTNAFLLHLYA